MSHRKTTVQAGAVVKPAFDYFTSVLTVDKNNQEQLKALEKNPELNSLGIQILTAYEEFIQGGDKINKPAVVRLKQTLAGCFGKYRSFATIFAKHAYKKGYRQSSPELAKYVQCDCIHVCSWL